MTTKNGVHDAPWTRWPLPSFDELKARAEELDCPITGVLALAPDNDPYAAGRGRRAHAAQWFAAVWQIFDIPEGWHLRRIHYLLVSRPDVVPLPDGRIYTNTIRDWRELCYASRDAVALSLVPPDLLSDARNDAPLIIYRPDSRGAEAELRKGMVAYQPFHHRPQLQLLGQEQGLVIRPQVERPYQVEIWAEKTTVNDVLRPLAYTYDLNIVTASGEISATACRQLVSRAARNGKPVRVLYVSDFDPAGRSIPVAMARKVEYEIDRRQLDLDIQVRPVVLTHEQCVQYNLPRTPIKESERRAAGFEERYGEGATELDALEALHPGVLRLILVAEIERYWNPDHNDIVDQASNDFEDAIAAVNKQVADEFRDEFNALDAEVRRVAEGIFTELRSKANDLFARMSEQLEARKPTFELPEIEFAADEDDNALFDSQRGYLDQVAAYKKFQGKE
jgi:hypothetical protein